MFRPTSVLHVRLPIPKHITPAVKNLQTLFVGTVVSAKADKTIKVAIPRAKVYPKIKAKVWIFKNFLVHDEFELCKPGDTVQIRSCRPLSKQKHFLVDEILKQARQFDENEQLDLNARLTEIIKLHPELDPALDSQVPASSNNSTSNSE
eukprot:c22681_g1_i1.p1 GENE.c22681_g1_i1~~c22681_g1_i1.p1  ORF type:complete len:162 (+),score=67.31 c22681_g1_i1:40-486(+)